MTQAAFLEQFSRFAANGGGEGPTWLPALRRQAAARFEALGWPTTKNEDWHYTSVAPIAEGDFRTVTAASGAVSRADLAPFLFDGADFPTLVFVNGRFSADLSSFAGLPAGVEVLELARAWRERPELLEAHLGKQAPIAESSFTALNTAFMLDGAVISVSADVEVKTPIHLLFVNDATAAQAAVHPRNLIVLDRFAKATVVESYVSTSQAPYLTNAVTEVVVGDGATLQHYKIQRESPRAYHVGTTEATQGRDSHYVSFSFATGGALSRTNIYTHLRGPGCGSTLNGLYMLDGEQHGDHQTMIEHVEPNCFSREVYKGILDGASTGVFNGRVYVHPEAQQTDGKQSNMNLLLSERAHVDTKPQLEIFADDVKCTHGATVGRIDETALFYMKSRGVAADTARRLLVYAFAAEVLEQIESAPVREALERMTLERFTNRA